jgi:hypothetical protein
MTRTNANKYNRCHDCGVLPGEKHHDGCDVERCPFTKGQQRITCNCKKCDELKLSEKVPFCFENYDLTKRRRTYDFTNNNMSLDFYLTYKIDGNEIDVFDRNITHNLTKMADKAGIYYALWRPEEKGYKYAKDIVKVLEKGLKRLRDKPKYYEKFNAPNGWGLYEHLVPFVEKCLEACKKYPNAEVYSCR